MLRLCSTPDSQRSDPFYLFAKSSHAFTSFCQTGNIVMTRRDHLPPSCGAVSPSADRRSNVNTRAKHEAPFSPCSVAMHRAHLSWIAHENLRAVGLISHSTGRT